MTAIWEYDPTLPDNCVLNGSLDIIAAIWTLVIKVCFVFFIKFQSFNMPQIQSSGQHIEAFKKLQTECGIHDPLKILLHSNVWWGTAHCMLSVSYKICQVSQS